LASRLKVDALAGHFDAVLRDEPRFRDSWERCGRPVVPNLASSPSAVAMVHGILGDDAGRAEWLDLTKDILGVSPSPGARTSLPTFDAVVALHRGDFGAALGCLAADIDDPGTWWHGGEILYRPWYAALWAEAAVLDHHPDAADRIKRSRHAARDNPIAAAMVERAAALAAGDRDTLVRLAVTFARLGCPYQQARTSRMAAGPHT
jgi:hypothetical protein